MTTRGAVLAVCHNTRNLDLLVQFLARQGYKTRQAATLEALDEVLAEADTLSLALVDLSGFGREIWERCDRMHQADLPFLLISAGLSSSAQTEGVVRGARGVLQKPLVMKELIQLIDRLAAPSQDED